MSRMKIFIIFKGLSIIRNCLRPESGPLNNTLKNTFSVLQHLEKEDYNFETRIYESNY